MSTAAFRVDRHSDAERFLAVAEPWLLGDETENNLVLGIALGARSRAPSDSKNYWATIHSDDGIVGCACRTPPHPLVLSRMPAAALTALSQDVSATYPSLEAINGPATEALAFAAVWIAQQGGSWRKRFELRLHELRHPPSVDDLAAGELRKASDRDLATAREWVAAYVRDTGLHAPVADVARGLIDRGQLFLWIDGDAPRSMVATSRATSTGCSINTVYTPPPFRRHGYATAIVAALSGALLNEGRQFCCLYTDAANPTSNSIYAKIGYRAIRDDIEIAFEREARTSP